MQSELEQYEFQLQQVKLALETDPHNLELKKLVHDLQELIDLSKQLQPSTSTSTSTSTSNPTTSSSSSNHHHYKVKSKSKSSLFSPASSSTSSLSTSPTQPSDASPLSSSLQWKIGDRVLAQWHDQQWYEATVTAVSTKWSEHEPLYSVVFTGYTTVEIKPSSSLRPLSFTSSSSNSFLHQPHSLSPSTFIPTDSSQQHHVSTLTAQPKESILDPSSFSSTSSISSISTNPTSSSTAAASKTRLKKKTKQEFQLKHQKRQTKLAQLEKVHQQAQQSWLHFASGGNSSTISHSTNHKLKKAKATVSSLQPIPILKKKSMFATPDNPYAKVGVIGSGQGMTEFHDRGKHKFDYLE